MNFFKFSVIVLILVIIGLTSCLNFGEPCIPYDPRDMTIFPNRNCTCDTLLKLNCSSPTCGKCVCNNGLYYHRQRKECLALDPGIRGMEKEPCLQGPKSHGEQCSVTAAMDDCRKCDANQYLRCSVNKACVCPEGSYFSRKQGHCVVFPGYSCSVNPHCHRNSYCKVQQTGNLYNATCACQEGLIHLSDNNGRQECYLSHGALCKINTIKGPKRGVRVLGQCHTEAGLQCVLNRRIRTGKSKKYLKGLQEAIVEKWHCDCIYGKEFFTWSRAMSLCVGLEGTFCSTPFDLVNLTGSVTKQFCSVNSFCNDTTSQCQCASPFTADRSGKCNVKKCSSDTCIRSRMQKCDVNGTSCICENLPGTTFPMVYDGESDECRVSENRRCGLVGKYEQPSDTRIFTCEHHLTCRKCGEDKDIGICIRAGANEQCVSLAVRHHSQQSRVFFLLSILVVLRPLPLSIV